MRARIIRFLLIGVIFACVINWHITKNKAISYFLKNARMDQHGLTGFYYANTECFGSPSSVRVDPEISFNSNTSPDFQRDYFSVYWAGLIHIEKAGKYKFFTFSDDGSLLYIDHKIAVDNSGIHPRTKKKDKVYLKKGYHPIELRYNEYYNEACMELHWQQPDKEKEVISCKYLIPVLDTFNIYKTDRLYMNMLKFDLILFILLGIAFSFTKLEILLQSLKKINWPLALILLLGTYLRFSNLTLMEFKGDETTALFIAKDLTTLRNVPLTGLLSSTGIYNPPLFIYLVTIPFLISQNPLFITAFIVISNILAIYLCYKTGEKFHSKTAGLISSILFSVSPWAIIFSKKIWNPDLLPVFTAAFLYLILCWTVKKEKNKLPWILILFTCILQLHYSALGFIPFLILIYVLFRPPINIKPLSKGIFISSLLLLPFIIFIIKNNFQDFKNIPSNNELFGIKQCAAYFYSFFESALDKINFFNFNHLIGDTVLKTYNPAIYICAILERYIFITGLIYIGIMMAIYKKRRITNGITFLWFIIPITVYSFTKINQAPHYTAILYPVQFLIMGIFLSDISNIRILRPVAIIIISSIITTQIIFNIYLYKAVNLYGTSWGDAGFDYKHKRDAIKYIMDNYRDNMFTVSSTRVQDSPQPNFSFHSLHPEYWYFLWLYTKSQENKRINLPYHFFISRSSDIPKNLRYLKYTRSRPFGHWRVYCFKALQSQSRP